LADLLTGDEQARYSRQLALPGWGEAAQVKLKQATVFIAGVGGLGSFVAQCLAAAGVGRLVLCDPDTVQLSNLNRQTLYSTDHLGAPKAAIAAQVLHALNPTISVEAIPARIDEDNYRQVIGQPNIVVDCLDNFAGRFLLNACAVETGIPFVHGGVSGWAGMVTFIHPPQTPCLACLYPEAPDEQVTPTLSVAPALVGSAQAGEVIKYLLKLGELLAGRLLTVEMDTMQVEIFQMERSPSCPVCADGGKPRPSGS
jgi:molybdopterin/thiamine biosynthesis adenylyltransferase